MTWQPSGGDPDDPTAERPGSPSSGAGADSGSGADSSGTVSGGTGPSSAGADSGSGADPRGAGPGEPSWTGPEAPTPEPPAPPPTPEPPEPPPPPAPPPEPPAPPQAPPVAPPEPPTVYQAPSSQQPSYQTPEYQTPEYQAPGYPPPPPPQYPPGAYPPGAYPPGAYPPGGYQTPYPVVESRGTNGLAVAALVCSLAGFITVISAPVGAVLGHMAMRQIAQTGEEGAGMAKAAIIVGWILTGLTLLACCIGAIIIIAAVNSTN